MDDMQEVIDPEETIIKRKVACLYHADADGWGSAYAVWKALQNEAEFLFIKVQYGQEPPYEELRAFGPELIFIVDFSYNAATLHLLEGEFKKVVVIDHHKTSLAELEEWDGEYVHDTTKAGCQLTWDYFFFNDEEGYYDDDPPDILLYVADRDMWEFRHEHSKEINAYIATLDEDFQVWDDFYTPEAYDCGKAILKFQKMQIERRLRDVVMMSFSDVTRGEARPHFESLASDLPAIPFVNASENQSELGEAMCEAYPDAPFSVSYCDRPDGKRSYSLRSRNGFDVSAVAKAFGGGGHPGAAGFTLNAPDII